MNVDLPVPVVIDPETDAWSVDGFPMILMPRHFWALIMQEVEAKIGLDETAKLYFDGTYKAAYLWCEKEAVTHGLSGVDVFNHYLTRMTQRGWGQLHIVAIDPAVGNAQVRVDHSATALAYGPKTGRPVCQMFNGAFCGSMEYVAAHAGNPMTLASREVACLANGDDHCLFEVTPKS